MGSCPGMPSHGICCEANPQKKLGTEHQTRNNQSCRDPDSLCAGQPRRAVRKSHQASQLGGHYWRPCGGGVGGSSQERRGPLCLEGTATHPGP